MSNRRGGGKGKSRSCHCQKENTAHTKRILPCLNERNSKAKRICHVQREKRSYHIQAREPRGGGNPATREEERNPATRDEKNNPANREEKRNSAILKGKGTAIPKGKNMSSPNKKRLSGDHRVWKEGQLSLPHQTYPPQP